MFAPLEVCSIHPYMYVISGDFVRILVIEHVSYCSLLCQEVKKIIFAFFWQPFWTIGGPKSTMTTKRHRFRG